MDVCCECCVLSGRGLCDGLITRPEESYRLRRVVVCDKETSKTRRLKPPTGLWKYNHTSCIARKTNNKHITKFSFLICLDCSSHRCVKWNHQHSIIQSQNQAIPQYMTAIQTHVSLNRACTISQNVLKQLIESSWNVMAHGDAREGKWSGNWRMEWVASTLHTTSKHGVSSITTADAHTLDASSRLNWRPHQFKWTRPFRRKTKSGFCACAITFQTQSISHCR